MRNIIKYDVVIAGAGPAGCASAIILKQAGLKVCVVDNNIENSRKVGETILTGVVRLLNTLGINGIEHLLDESDYNKCAAINFEHSGYNLNYFNDISTLNSDTWQVNRNRFEQALREKTISLDIPIFPTRVDYMETSVDESGKSGYILRLRNSNEVTESCLQTTWLIDATGRNASISRRFDISRQRIDNQMAAVYWVKAAHDDSHFAGQIKYTGNGLWYTALLPERTRIISLKASPNTVSEMIKDPKTFFEAFNATSLISYPINAIDIVEIKAIEAGISRLISATAPGLVCVGDAAVALDPVSSHSLFFALYSGIKGAEAIIKCLANPQKTQNLLLDYQLKIDHIFETNVRLARPVSANNQAYPIELYG